MSLKTKKMLYLLLGAAAFFACGTLALAASGAGGVGGVAAHVRGNLTDIAKLITAGSYVAGMGFAVAAIVKFKAHKEQPTQIPVGTPIVLLFVAAALLFAPSVFKTSGETLFKSGQTGGISGTVEFTT